MQEKNNSYLICTFAVSKDKYHKHVGLRHLVGKVFFTCDLKWEKLLNQHKNSDTAPSIIFKISKDTVSPYFNTEGNILYCNLYYFFGFNLSDKNKFFKEDNFLDVIFNNKPVDFVGPYFDKVFSKSVFIFDDVSWLDLQFLFRYRRVQLSGGSITRRHLVSTVDYLLLKNLISMGYSLEDIFNSAKVLSSAKFNQESDIWSGYKFDYIKNILDSLISDDIDSLNVKKESLVKEILKLKSENSIQVFDKQRELEALELKITTLINFSFELSSMSTKHLTEYYYNNYYNQQRSYDLKLRSTFNKSLTSLIHKKI